MVTTSTPGRWWWSRDGAGCGTLSGCAVEAIPTKPEDENAERAERDEWRESARSLFTGLRVFKELTMRGPGSGADESCDTADHVNAEEPAKFDITS